MACEASSYCPAGAAAALPCSEGSYSDFTNLTSAAECTQTSPGHYAPTGSSTQLPCAAGTIAATGGLGACVACDAGTYQDAEGATVCKNCTDGYYCAEGASAPLPCPGGTTKRVGVVMTSAADCRNCSVGTYCPVGSAIASNCSAGTYNDQPNQEVCTRCLAGSFQDAEGAIACKICLRGHYCPEGSTLPMPCLGGRSSNASGLASLTQCLPVQPGFWAPTGSALPIRCPDSGFSCPGALAITVHREAGIDPPGSQPIPLKLGTISREVEETFAIPILTAELSLEQNWSAVNAAQVRARLAHVLGIEVDYIDLAVRVSRRRLQERRGSIIVAVRVTPSPADEAAQAALLAIGDRLRSMDEASLSNELGIHARWTAEVLITTQNLTRTSAIQIVCPMGHWYAAAPPQPRLCHTRNS